MLDQLNQIEQQALQQIEGAANTGELSALESSLLGKKGEVTAILRSVGQLPPDQRPAVGKRANEVRVALEAAFARRADELRATELEHSFAGGAIDVTLPGRPVPVGRLHPVTRTLREIYDIWAEMGFQVYLSPEIVSDDYNFTLLNMPPHHPARDMWDTFYTTQPGVMPRTHTSPGQIYAMREFAPEPIRIILPGMVYRYEQQTARSEFQFHQVEGLAVGYNITLADLKGTMAAFARRYFGADKQVRFRCSHFPFTEPSVEVDVDCILCNGDGCPVCKYTGWLEISGAGMVHPTVLKNGGYDPEVFTGFAFGMGVERSTLMKHSIQDIRYFWGNDLRFLEQF